MGRARHPGSMSDSLRTADLVRTGPSAYRATNVRGATLDLGDGSTPDFTPIELLLVALAGCTAVTADPIVSRRAEPATFDVHARADKVRDEHGNHLVDVRLTFDVAFSGDGAEAARAALDDALRLAEERLCTVSRTVALGTPTRVEVRDV